MFTTWNMLRVGKSNGYKYHSQHVHVGKQPLNLDDIMAVKVTVVHWILRFNSLHDMTLSTEKQQRHLIKSVLLPYKNKKWHMILTIH